jgi:hypothetical protein
MKNYQPYVWAVAGDGAGGTLGFGWFFTLEEAQTWFASLDLGGSGSVPPTQYYTLLNKWNIAILMDQAKNITGTNTPNQQMFTTDHELAQTFSQDNPGPAGWNIDTVDGKWQKNAIQSKQLIVESGKTKVGTVKLTFAQVLLSTYDVFRFQLKDLTRANLVLDIYNLWRRGTITTEVASSRLTFILNPLIRGA